MTGKGTGVEGGTSTGMSARVGIGARTRAGAGTRIYMRVEGRESLGTYKGVKRVGRKAREGKRCQ